MMKDDLFRQFNLLKPIDGSYCTECTECANCLMCKNLVGKNGGYWLLNNEVSKESYEDALNTLTGA